MSLAELPQPALRPRLAAVPLLVGVPLVPFVFWAIALRAEAPFAPDDPIFLAGWAMFAGWALLLGLAAVLGPAAWPQLPRRRAVLRTGTAMAVVVAAGWAWFLGEVVLLPAGGPGVDLASDAAFWAAYLPLGAWAVGSDRRAAWLWPLAAPLAMGLSLALRAALLA